MLDGLRLMNDADYERRVKEGLEKYCPVCARNIIPSNIEEVRRGEHDGFIYVHDDIDHADSDIEALEKGIQ